MESYNVILKRMTDAYEEESGCKVEDVSDIGLRLRVLAGEIHRALSQVEWLRHQAFPQTATGEDLDRHGAQRGLKRRGPQKAVGEVTFSRYVPLTFDVVIPAGTHCAAAGEAVEYVTLSDATLTAGTLTVTAPAQAVEPGAQGNAAAGYINTLVTPVSGVQYISNRAAFTGGADEEGDEAFRARVLESFKKPLAPGNPAFYEELVLAQPGVTSAQAVPQEDGPGTVSLYVWGDGAAPGEEALAALNQVVNKNRELGIVVTVKAAASKKANLAVRVAPSSGADFDTLKAQGQAALGQWVAGLPVGAGITQAQFARFIVEHLPVDKVEFLTNGNSFTATPGTKPIAGTFSIAQLS